MPESAGAAAVVTEVTGKTALSVRALEQRAMAPRRHGLWAKSVTESRQRAYKAGRLLRRLEIVLEQQGRPLTEEQIPAARSWAEFGVIADQVYAALMQSFRKGEVPSPKLLDAWRGMQRDRLLHATALGLTPIAKAELAATMSDLQRHMEAEAARQRLVAQLSKPAAPPARPNR